MNTDGWGGSFPAITLALRGELRLFFKLKPNGVAGQADVATFCFIFTSGLHLV
jgi:hypothetical protein